MKKNKVILSLIFAFIFTFSAFGLAACTINCGAATTPVEQNQSNTDNNVNTNNNNTNNNNNSDNNNQSGNNGENEESIIDKLSDITKTIETDSYYRSLGQKNTDNHQYITPDILPIPYKFLRNHGHDVDAYLDGTLDVFASSYIYDNDKNHIYVSVKAENVSTSQYGNYYTNYVLQYPLTDQEYEDYITLSKSACIQSLFFIQELDNQKTPEIVNQINVQVETYKDMITKYSQYKELNQNSNTIEIDIYTFNINEIEISIRNGSSSNMLNNHIGFIKLEPNKIMAGVEMYDNSVMKLDDANWINYKNLDEYKSSLQNITSFSYGDRVIGTNPYSYDLFDNAKN